MSRDLNRLFRARTKDYLNKTLFYGRDSRRTPEAMEYLRRIVALARREGIDLRLVINPPHAMMMEVIRYRGFWAEYEDWKRDLVRVAHGPGGAPVPLIDFSGYNAFTTGDVPGAGQPQRRMRWHWEITHFNQKMGAEVLKRVYAPPGMEIPPAGTFGVRLTPANVESHLAAIRAERHAYVSAHPTEMGWLKQLAH